MKTGEQYYDSKYFEWQRIVGAFGGWANCPKFEKYIHHSDSVIDFGCGGGYLLSNMSCKNKIGIEVNPIAKKNAEDLDIKVYTNTLSVPDNWADVIISNHALEHTLNPLQELKDLYKKLKNDGKIIFVVPCESIQCAYKENNINHHLFTWSPLNIGNLFMEAGFSVIESKEYKGTWPKHVFIKNGMFIPFIKKLGIKWFTNVTFLYSFFYREVTQVRVIATK